MKNALPAILALWSTVVAGVSPLPEAVVTGSRTAVTPVERINREAIEVFQSANLLDVLDRAPGVHAFSKGGAGGTSYLSIHGGEPNYTLVLLEGVRLNDPMNSQGGSFDFAQIAPFAIEGIDVATGALSAVQGADALSGVVQMRLRTPTPDERSLSVSANADTADGWSADAGAGYGWRGGGLLVTGGRYDSGELTPGSELQRSQALVRVAHDTRAVSASAFLLHADTSRIGFPEDSGGPRLAANRERETRDTRLTAAAFDLAGSGPASVQPHAAVRWSRQTAVVDTPAIAGGVYSPVPAIASDSRFERLEFVADLRADLGQAVRVAAGAEYVEERGRSDAQVDLGFLIPAGFAIDRSIGSGFVEATVAASDRLEFTGGVRIDDPSGLDAEWSGRGRVAFQPAPSGPLLFASVSRGFKLPSLFALAFPLIANPTLKPETGTTAQAGLEQAFSDRGSLRIVMFHNAFRDMIDFDPALFTNVNRSEVTARGISASFAAQPTASVRATGNVTYTDIQSATPLRSRPDWQGALTLTWLPRADLQFDLGGRFNSSYLDSSVPTGLVQADDHVEVDVALRWRAMPRLQISLVVRNLLGADYEESVGFPAAGRVARLGARLDL